jgi:hypothetical protein
MNRRRSISGAWAREVRPGSPAPLAPAYLYQRDRLRPDPAVAL